MKHVYWMGGSPCSGKTTISSLLAEQHGWQVYHCDDHFMRHVQQADPLRQPHLSAIGRRSWDEIFVQPTVAEQVERAQRAYHDEFAAILADLRALPADRPLLAEGAALLPELVQPLLHDPHRAIWVVPSESFQRDTYPRTRFGWMRDILEQCSDPALALQNWMDRDVAFAQAVLADAQARDLRVLLVDATRDITANMALVEAHFLGRV